MTVAFLSLGSNVEPEKNILEAVKLLSKHVRVLESSTVYLTEPLLRTSQPKYYNCVVEIETKIEPHELKFDVLRVIEGKLERKRTKDKYAPRTIDMDLIIYGDLHFTTKELVIPDPEIQERAFLAVPLFEIAPGLVLPVTNEPIKEIAGRFRSHRMVPLKSFTETLRELIVTLSSL
jgi:dihydroneopterin aldolase/2-amino-4-hydroxy-6-hydroxymethyldihydropteridine diphosphokinase